MSDSCPRWPVDGHVHFHEVDRVAPTLDAAAQNFREQGPVSGGLSGVVLLAQTANERVYEALAAGGQTAGWTITAAADERETLVARKGPTAIAIVCGRQVRTAEGLEVLALGSVSVFPDGLPFGQTVEQVAGSGAITVLPWGFGKWLGDRGAQVRSVLDRIGNETLFLGDNGGRPALMGVPALIRQSAGRGFRVLPGTDPLPVAGDHDRVGQFGFLVKASSSERAPWNTLRGWLLARHDSPEPYGRACGVLRFAVNQARLRAARHLN